jgi:isocitrate/isopropylmalate dehydrogenase
MRVMGALGSVLTAGQVRTRDLGGTATTAEFADAVCRAIEMFESRTTEKAV